MKRSPETEALYITGVADPDGCYPDPDLDPTFEKKPDPTLEKHPRSVTVSYIILT